MNLMFPAAKGVINPHLHWPPGTKLRVYFRTGKFPTWRMNSHPRMEFLTCGKILEMANIWRRRGGVTIPELVLTEDIQESDIRVFLSVHRPSMSYVGTEAKNYEMEDTMVLNLSRNDDDFRQYVVVHTFGHALGLGHMHQSSYLVKALDEHLTIEWLQEESGLSLEDAVKKFNADFKSYAGECTTEMGYFDASSVMCYPIDKKCFKSQTDHGLQQEDYDLITKTDDYSIRSGPSAADIRNVQAMYEVNPTSITTHPADQLLLVPGSPASFTVSVEAIPGHDHTYQWQKNKIDIVGATSNALIISSVTKTDEGTYCCVVSNTAGPVTSDPARLTIYADRDKISSSPGSKSGGEATYDVFISYKNGAVSEGYATAIDRHLTEAGYKVYRDEKNLAGGTTINKELAAAIHNSSVFLPILCSQYVTKPGERWCQSELNYAKEENKRFLPVVIDGVPIPPHILLIIDPQIKRLEYDSANPQPCIKEVTRSIQGMLGSRSVVPPDQQCTLPGCHRRKYKEPNGKTHEYCGRRHALEFARRNEQQESPPTVKSHPTGQLILVPRSMATFSISVEAIPGHDYIYQWQKNKTDIPGATLKTYTIQSVTKANEGMYHCIVSNTAALGISSSDPVQLTVCEDRSPKEIYDSALSHGHINVRNLLCLINGAARAGKTSVKYLLYGLLPPQDPDSTPLADIVFRPMQIERMSMDTKQYEWKELKTDEQIKAIISEAMTVETKKKTQPTKPQVPHKSVVTHQVVEESASRKTQESATQGTQESATRETQESASQGAQGPVSQEAQEEHVTTTVMKDLLTLIAKLSDTRKEILDLQHCYIIDSGGQSAFQELLSLFFGDIHVSISVLDLSERLDARPIDQLTMDRKKYGSLIKCALTQQDILECTFRALQTQMSSTEAAKSKAAGVQTQMSSTEEAESEAVGGKFPLLIVVGTHKDEEHETERICDKNDKLFQILKEKKYEHHIISCGSSIENALFSVNAKDPDDEDRRIVELLKHNIAGIFTSLYKTPIPIKWYVLELCLRQKKVNILTFAQCCEIANQLEMEEGDLIVMLDHLMKLKTLFYFKEVESLRNLVFINPQPLLNRLSQLVEIKYRLHGDPNKDADRNFVKGRLTLKYVNSEGFQHHLHKCHFQSYVVDDSMFSFGQFLELLVHKRVATKISQDEYFLPFILDKLETSELYQQVKHDKYIAPLAICFPGGVAPAGVFCCLVASFLSLTYNPSQQSPWKFERCPLYRNILKFKFKQTPQDFSLTLLDAYTHFEAHINMPSSEAFSHLVTEICSRVKSEVVKCLKEMCEGRKLSYKLAIVCQAEVARCDSESRNVSHYATLWNTGKDTVYDCVNESCIERCEPITARAKCWGLGNVNPPSIKTHPADQLMLVPQSSASFNVSVEVIPGCDYTYQWHKNETDIVGATSNALTISSITKTDEGTYCCAVSNPAGSVTSDPAQLTVLYPPTVKVHPADQLMLVPQSSANFTVSVEDIPGHDHTYQWQKNNINIVGATSDAHTITCVVKTDEGMYCCVVSNAAGTVTSDLAQLTVLNPPTIINHPTNQLMLVPRSSANFTVSVGAIPGHDHTYQWHKNKTVIVGATSNSHAVSSVSETDEGTYCCVVSNPAGSVTSNPAQLTVLNPPTIKTHPADQLILVPQSPASFTVSVETIPGHDHTYQWQKNKIDIVGATSNAHTISSVVKTDEGTYCCVVSNAAGPVTSDPARLTILNPPTIKTQPTDQLMLVPQSSASFNVSVEAIPGCDYTYQWHKNETDIVGATSNALIISSVTMTDEGMYCCAVRNPAGSVTSDPAQLTVLYPPTVKVHPADQLMLVRSSANFTVSVEDIPGHDHTYQWQKNNINIVGATSDAHTITCVVKTDEGTYCCVVSNAAGTMTSDRAQLTVLNPPTIINHPTNQLMLVPRSSANFTVSVGAIPGHDHTYQWHKNKTVIVGATSNSHTISSVSETDQGTYCCVVSNPAGSVTSNPVHLTVLNPPTIKTHPADQLMLVPQSPASFTVSVEVIPGHDHTYQWQQNKIDIVGATSNAHTITRVVKTDEGTYCCVVSNTAGSVTSDPARLIVCSMGAGLGRWGRGRGCRIQSDAETGTWRGRAGRGPKGAGGSHVTLPGQRVQQQGPSPTYCQQADFPGRNEKATMVLLNNFPDGKGGHFCIPRRIPVEVMEPFGIALLPNDGAVRVSSIKHQKRGEGVAAIVHQFLMEWVQGQGKEDYTWNGLIEVLRQPAINLRRLADEIEDVVGKSTTPRT